jgi:twitching motility protein PilT
VTGPTGCGKSSTLAALVDEINNHRADHVVTIEDPIEFVHANRKSIIEQIEVGRMRRTLRVRCAAFCVRIPT